MNVQKSISVSIPNTLISETFFRRHCKPFTFSLRNVVFPLRFIYLFIYLFYFFCILLRKPYVVYIFAFGTQRMLKLFILFDIFKHNYLFINYLSKWVAPVFELYLLILTNGVQKLGFVNHIYSMAL